MRSKRKAHGYWTGMGVTDLSEGGRAERGVERFGRVWSRGPASSLAAQAHVIAARVSSTECRAYGLSEMTAGIRR